VLAAPVCTVSIPMSHAFHTSRRRLLIAAGCAAATPALAAAPDPDARPEMLRTLLAERRSIWLVRGKEEIEAT
jgi:hypothetical protein